MSAGADSSSATREEIVGEEDAGDRLDRFLADRLDLPRNQVQRLLRDDRVTLEDPRHGAQRVKASRSLEPGQIVRCVLDDEPPDPGLEPEPGELRVLFADEHLAVIDKPSGLAVHPGAGRREGTLAHRLLHHFPEIAGVGGRGRPGIVHRLDLDTTGALLVARTTAAYHALVAAFAERRVEKRYVAIVHGRPADDEGTIDSPLGRHPRDRKRMTVRPDGRPALTHWRAVASVESIASILDLEIETGRTHQIRVHTKEIGHPIVGDSVYGEARWRGVPNRWRAPLRDFPRPALHARRLALDHPITGERLRVEAPVPEDLRALWHALADADWP